MNRCRRLTELKVEVTRRCPLYCLHCSSNGQPDARETLPTERLVRLVAEFRQAGGQKMAITGGEPLLHDGLATLVEACHNSEIDTELYTTGITCTGNRLAPISGGLLDTLAENAVKVIFSLHGAFPKTHDFVTQTEGSFAMTVRAMERARAAGVNVEVHFVPTAVNFREMADVCRLVTSLGVRRISWLRFVPQGRGKGNRDLLQLNRERLAHIARQKAELSHELPYLEIRMGAPFNILCSQSPAACMAGMRELVIRPDGRAVPCDAFKQFGFPDRYDNIMEFSLAQVWQGSSLLSAVRWLGEARPNATCSSCPSFSICQSGCLAQKALAAGALQDGPDPQCLCGKPERQSGKIAAVAVG